MILFFPPPRRTLHKQRLFIRKACYNFRILCHLQTLCNLNNINLDPREIRLWNAFLKEQKRRRERESRRDFIKIMRRKVHECTLKAEFARKNKTLLKLHKLLYRKRTTEIIKKREKSFFCKLWIKKIWEKRKAKNIKHSRDLFSFHFNGKGEL